MRLRADRVLTWHSDSFPEGLAPQKLYFGPDPYNLGGIQIAVASAVSPPSRKMLRDLFALRKGKTQVQLVLAVVCGDVVYLLGPDPEIPPLELPVDRAERQLQSALSEPDVIAATERLAGFRKASSSIGAAGFSNSGLFASHHLKANVPRRLDWAAKSREARPLLNKRGRELIDALGFVTQPGQNGTVLLSAGGGSPRAVAVLLDDSEQFDTKTQRFQLSPVALGLTVASRMQVPWLVVLRKDQIRLYPGRDGVGVGSKGQAETYFEVDLSVVASEYAAFLPLIFSAAALAEHGTTDALLEESARYATELGARLRERIYEDVVPALAVAVAQQLAGAEDVRLDDEDLDLAYRVTLRILFRLLFQAYAEDRELLPAGRNQAFDDNSLNTLAHRLLKSDLKDVDLPTGLWANLVRVWEAIDHGNQEWQIPPYNGGLFSADVNRSPEGAALAELELPDSILGPALKSLLIDVSNDGVLGPVDFSSLSVREFGTIYEGLLESSLSHAQQDLIVDSNGIWVPAKEDDAVEISAGEIYFHSASGERKATGSYFTPKLLVDHLIERSVVPTLTAHLDKIARYLDEGEAAAAAREFFDFRVADIAMGSGHFLVAAVDKIEALMRAFLTEHSVPGVTDELLRLSVIARDALGMDEVAKSEVDEVGLLRRQIARRCIYGLDINPMAVELARLALWVHTFVPGLPMSNLDHGLVAANSLTGVGSVEEALEALDPDRGPGVASFYDDLILDNLASSKSLLLDVANASEANKAEVEQGARLLAQAREAAATAQGIFDAAVATRTGKIPPGAMLGENALRSVLSGAEVTAIAEELQPAHMPYLFPEVFLRENPGFDVLLGNPPWEEVKVEERSFWLKYRPGLFGLSDGDRVAEIDRLRTERADLIPKFEQEKTSVEGYVQALRTGPFPGMGTGDPELAKAFAWRNWQLVRENGAIGLVGPRTLLNTKGAQLWRKEVLSSSQSDLIVIINSARWAFDMEPRYAIALMAIKKTGTTGRITFAGPFHSEKEFRERSTESSLSYETIAKATNEATIPNISDARTGEVFEQIRLAPRLDEVRPGWDYGPVREFDVTNDRKFYDAGGPGDGRVPVWGGDGFYIWVAETGEVKAWADPAIATAELQRKRKRQIRTKSSAFYGQSPQWAADPATLPFQSARIAFRGVSQRTNQRTVISALIPGGVYLQNSSPYFFRRAGSARTDAWLLAFLSSIPLDWYARTLIETNLNLFILRGFPIPIFNEQDPLHRRVVELSGRLAAVDERFCDWAEEVGVPVGTLGTDAERADAEAELDALVSHVYGLKEDDIEYIFQTFHRGWNYDRRLQSVLDHYQSWKGV